MLASFVRTEPLCLFLFLFFVYYETTRESSFQHALGVKENKYWILYECKIA